MRLSDCQRSTVSTRLLLFTAHTLTTASLALSLSLSLSDTFVMHFTVHKININLMLLHTHTHTHTHTGSQQSKHWGRNQTCCTDFSLTSAFIFLHQFNKSVKVHSLNRSGDVCCQMTIMKTEKTAAGVTKD